MQTYECSITLLVEADSFENAAQKAQAIIDEPCDLFMWEVKDIDTRRPLKDRVRMIDLGREEN